MKSSLLCNESALGNIEVVEITDSFDLEVVLLCHHVHGNLLVKFVDELISLLLLADDFAHDQLIGFLRSKMSLIILFINKSLYLLLLFILLNLDRQLLEIIEIILLPQLQVVWGNYILFLLLPVELFSLEIPDFFNLFAFIFKSSVGLVVDSLDIENIVLALSFCMVVYFEWTLGSQEVWVCVIVVWAGDVLSFKCLSYHVVLNVAVLSLRCREIIECSVHSTLIRCMRSLTGCSFLISVVDLWRSFLVVNLISAYCAFGLFVHEDIFSVSDYGSSCFWFTIIINSINFTSNLRPCNPLSHKALLWNFWILRFRFILIFIILLDSWTCLKNKLCIWRWLFEYSTSMRLFICSLQKCCLDPL